LFYFLYYNIFFSQMSNEGGGTWERKGLEMKGGGFYSAHTKGAGAAIMNALPLLLEALQGALATGDPASNKAEASSASRLPTDLSLFTIADYGAADGGTSQGSY
jgi:hypothetical protein